MQPSAEPALDADLLRRYDIPGPRYTSYPTAPQFRSDFDETSFREHTARDETAGSRYVERLIREIAAVAPLFHPRRETRQLHLGGGTPNFLRRYELALLIDALARQFRLSDSDERDFSIEIDPRFATAADIRHLAQLGFNRLGLGVQDFDPRVQQAANRIQSTEQILGIIDSGRVSGFRSVNVDLIYGLPHQRLEGFGRTLETVIAARPDRLAVAWITSHCRMTISRGRRPPAACSAISWVTPHTQAAISSASA